MRAALLLLAASCAVPRVCAPVDPEQISAFHENHAFSNVANSSSVGDLGAYAYVCIEGGRATFATDGGKVAAFNHPKALMLGCDRPEVVR